MLSWVVIFSRHPDRSALRSRLSVSSPVMLLLLPTSLPTLPPWFINPRVTSYEISRRPSPFCSASYKMLFPQLLCFENYPSFMGVYTPQRGNHELHNRWRERRKESVQYCTDPRPRRH